MHAEEEPQELHHSFLAQPLQRTTMLGISVDVQNRCSECHRSLSDCKAFRGCILGGSHSCAQVALFLDDALPLHPELFQTSLSSFSFSFRWYWYSPSISPSAHGGSELRPFTYSDSVIKFRIPELTLNAECVLECCDIGSQSNIPSQAHCLLF